MLGLVVVFSVNTIFDVDDDTYAGRRVLLLVVGTGIVIVNVASASGPEYSGAAIADGTGGGTDLLCDPSPHAARDAEIAIAKTEDANVFPSRFIGTIFQFCRAQRKSTRA
jgi:hypothetical protein